MATGRTGIVGVLVGDASDPYFAAIVRGVEDVARQHGQLVVVCNSDRDPAIELQYLRALNDYRVDGLIFAGGGLTDDGYVREIRKAVNLFRVTRRGLRRPRGAPVPVVPRPDRQRAGRARRRGVPPFARPQADRVPVGAAAPDDDRVAAGRLPRGQRRARPGGRAGVRPRGRLHLRGRRPGGRRHPRPAAEADRAPGVERHDGHGRDRRPPAARLHDPRRRQRHGHRRHPDGDRRPPSRSRPSRSRSTSWARRAWRACSACVRGS